MSTSSVCSDYIFSIKEAARPILGKQLFIRLTVCALCVMHMCNLSSCFRGHDFGSDASSALR